MSQLHHTDTHSQFIILGGKLGFWEKILSSAPWRSEHFNDLRQLRTSLDLMLSVVVIDLTRDDFSYMSLSTLITHYPKTRWIAYIDPKQLELERIRLFISRYCLDYITNDTTTASLYSRVLPQIKMLPLLQEDYVHQLKADQRALLGESKPILKLKDQINRVAKADVCLLIQGGVGVGKSLVACKVHQQSARRLQTCIELDCETLPHSSSQQDQSLTLVIELLKEALQKANDGTLILKNIEFLPMQAQSHVLSCLSDQDLDFQLQPDKLNVRIIATTRLHLNEAVLKRYFTPELIFRFNALHIEVPSLKDRISDLPILAQHFIDIYSLKYKGQAQYLSEDAIELLSQYEWPGNIHELMVRIKHVVLIAKETEISKDYFDLPSLYFGGDNLKSLRDVCEKEAIVRVLNSMNGHVTDAAKSLSISRATMYRLIEKHNIMNLI